MGGRAWSAVVAAVAALVAVPTALAVVPAGGRLPAPPRARGLAPYARKAPPISTPWTARAQRTAVPLPEYPRPQMERDQWLNLNGDWGFRTARMRDRPHFAVGLPQTIRVPFPPQSALSGIMRTSPHSFYERAFTIPASWRGRGVLLHFGAVNYRTHVYVNGVSVGSHTGGYDSFTLDITRALKRGANELFVDVFDPGEQAGQPVGKQARYPAGSVFFTASSGIWQTVWLEPVSPAHITKLDIVPDPERQRVLVTPLADGAARSMVLLKALDGRRVVGTASGLPGHPIAVPVPGPKLWSPDRPFLYNLNVELRRGGAVSDRVRSYFGMRTIGLAMVGGVTRIVLNGKFILQDGVLDQGYWPDGIYTAPSDAALRFDLAQERALGFNMVRKHVKVEPDRWYYWADRLGMLFWQDMPSMWPFIAPPNRARRGEFERELFAMVRDLRSHPSIVGWIPFNEGWGAFDVGAVIAAVKRLDPTRLVDGDSGSANCCQAPEPGSPAAGGGSGGDVRDAHLYMGPYGPAPDHRASMIGEYGGMFNRFPAHESDPAVAATNNLQRDATPDPTAACLRYQQMAEMLRQELRRPGVSAAVLTAWTDVENEIDGVMTYDRRVVKCDPAVIRGENRTSIAASRNAAMLTADPPSIPPGEVGYWPFDEASGAVAHDASGHGADLTLLGGAGWASGVHGGALSVGGTGQAAHSGQPLLDTRGDFAVAAWVQTADPTHDGSAVSTEGSVTNGFSLRLQAGHWSFAMAERDVPLNPAAGEVACPPIDNCLVRASNTPQGFLSDSRDNVVAGRWYYLVGVHTRATDSLVLYIDGVPNDSLWLGDTFSASGPFSIGMGRTVAGKLDAFNGLIDDLRVWDRALSSREVTQLYDAERG
jgi:hypothetical protein